MRSIRLDWIGFWRDAPNQDRVLKRSSIMSLSALSSPVKRASTGLGPCGNGGAASATARTGGIGPGKASAQSRRRSRSTGRHCRACASPLSTTTTDAQGKYSLSFAGFKDRHAVTSQHFTVPVRPPKAGPAPSWAEDALGEPFRVLSALPRGAFLVNHSGVQL